MKYGLVEMERMDIPTYPQWKIELLDPELECAGPDEYYLSSIGLWLLEEQKTKEVRGQVIYDHLKSTNLLSFCLNLQDGLVIQEKGIIPFRELFGNRAVFLWASAAASNNGQKSVPYLYERHYEQGSELAIAWHWFDDVWDRFRPALIFN